MPDGEKSARRKDTGTEKKIFTVGSPRRPISNEHLNTNRLALANVRISSFGGDKKRRKRIRESKRWEIVERGRRKKMKKRGRSIKRTNK